MNVVLKSAKSLCVLMAISISASVAAQDSNDNSPAGTHMAEPAGLDEERTNSNSESIEDKSQEKEKSESNQDAQPNGTQSTNGDTESITDQESQLAKFLSQLKIDRNLQFLSFVSLMAILTFLVYLWQSAFGVPEWLVLAQKGEEEPIEEQCAIRDQQDEPEKSVTHQEIADNVAIELAVQVWRLEKRVGQLDLNESPKLLRRMTDSVDKFKQLLENNDVVVDDPINRKYVDGWLEVKAIAWEEVPLEKCPDDIGVDPFVLETIRPIVRRDGRPISIGQIVVAECEGEKVL